MRRPPKLEWMGLMDVVGPFVTPAIVAEAFPSGLEGHDSGLLKGLRSAYKTWEDSDDPVWHREWVNVVLSNVLGYQEKHILQDQAIPESINYVDRTHHTTIRPTFIIHQPEFPDRGRILVMRLPKGESTSKPKAEAKWQASPISQMQMLLQANNEKVGLVTNGEEWVLVNNCGTGAVGFATWYAYLWLEEHDTLRSFRSLLSIRRVFGGEPGSRLVDLLAKGAEDQQDVTDRLGYQVRRAVEELVGAFERLDRDSNRELLKGVGETEVYEGVLTVMMRLVFLFCAEERGLLHLGEDLYDRFYAVSTLREQLHDDASKLTEEVLDRRSSAWCRLLATFRMVYQGVAHEDLRIPAYGGTLFDPDRFPWLEGRHADGTNEPPHVSDRIVLHLLDSLQVLRQGQEARKLSFHALDVEQIGHVYEGLLDHTAKRALKPVLGLVGKEGDEPEVDLETLEAKVAEGRDKFIVYLKDQTGKTERALGNLLDQVTDAENLRKLRVVCGDDHDLFERVKPFANLIREDSFGNVQVYPEGALYATVGSDRRSTGTHYTPRMLTEEVVKYALEPLVYVGPAEGLPEEEWTLKDAKAIVDLKVCDMAMGSGAFLVAACRFLSIKLVEAWAVAEEKAARRLGFSAEGHFFTHRIEGDHHAKTPGTTVATPFGDIAVADPSQELIPNDAEERLAMARRIVADRCLYGVDRNAMAVEMAKLSLWLTTLRKDRPFTFLDHALRHGDSLLGVTERQLEFFNVNLEEDKQSQALFLRWVPEYVEKVRNLRQQIARIPSHDPEAIRRKQRLFDQVRELEKPLKFAADALLACELSEGNAQNTLVGRTKVQMTLTEVPAGDRVKTVYPELSGRPTLHWELEFPDVFDQGGFDAVVGNPPYQGGRQTATHQGPDYHALICLINLVPGTVDLVCHFFKRAFLLIGNGGAVAVVSTNSVKETSNREASLDFVLSSGGAIYRATSEAHWGGAAAVTTLNVWIYKGPWDGNYFIDGAKVETIHSSLDADVDLAQIEKLKHSFRYSEGTKLYGDAFIISKAQLGTILRDNPGLGDYLRVYVNGDVLNDTPDCVGTDVVVDFGELDVQEISGCESIIRTLSSQVAYERRNQTRQIHEHRPWLHWDKRTRFFEEARSRERILACAIVSRRLMFDYVDPQKLFAHGIKLFLDDTGYLLAVLQSSIHTAWSRVVASRMRQETRYSTTDCFDTFPFPPFSRELAEAGNQLDEARRASRENRQIGLNGLYALVDDINCQEEDIVAVRHAIVSVDVAVASSLSWDPTFLEHGFHPWHPGTRFTISPQARKEVLRRLLKLNHERYTEEVAAGLHDKKAKKSSATPGSTPKRGRKPKSSQPDATDLTSPRRNLFDTQLTFGEVDN
ncbi:MAG: restriction endonuclease [Armatimonadetes bacterium]|nr:restriction endonuclease [Armatimonadota bacterium]